MKLKINHKKKSLSALFLAIVYLVISFHWVVPLSAYTINRQYIEENLCKNVQVVELDCHGKCYLSEKFVEPLDSNEESHQGALPQLENFEYPVHTEIHTFSFKLYLQTGDLISNRFSPVLQWQLAPPTPPPRSV